jgi:hypothetical protein
LYRNIWGPRKTLGGGGGSRQKQRRQKKVPVIIWSEFGVDVLMRLEQWTD